MMDFCKCGYKPQSQQDYEEVGIETAEGEGPGFRVSGVLGV